MTSGNAISLVNNMGGTINFSISGFGSGMNLTTTSGTGFNATGGGTVSVQGGLNTVSTTTGTALNVSNTMIGASGLIFKSITSTGGSNYGIVLSNTGSSAGLTVTGDGGAPNNGSGGTINNKIGDASGTGNGTDGIFLSNTAKVSLGYMNINNNNRNGILGQNVNGLLLNHCNIMGNANQASPDEAGILLEELTGTGTGGANPTRFINTTVSNSHEHNVKILNSAGVLTDLEVTGSTFSNNGASAQAGQEFLFQGTGSSDMTLSVSNSTFTGSLMPGNLTSNGIFADVAGGTMDVTVQTSTFMNNNVGVGVSVSSSGNMTFDILNNGGVNGIITGNRAIGINVFANASHTGTFSGTIQGNTIGTPGMLSSGSLFGSGIDISNEGGGTTTVLIDGNTVQEVGNGSGSGFEGIVVGNTVTAGILNTTITNNTIKDIRDDRGMNVFQTIAGTLSATIHNNTFSNIFLPTPLRVRQTMGTYNIVQLLPTAVVNVNELDDANGLTSPQVSIAGTINFGAAAPMLP